MKNVNILYIVVCIFFLACGQNISTQTQVNSDSTQSKNDTADTGVATDSNKIAILSSDKIDFFSLKDSIPARLTNPDIQVIETLLTDCLKSHNTGLDSTKLYSGYLDLKKYKRQYVAYLNAKGEKNVFINCFCSGVAGLGYWKDRLVMMDDGGKCFFNVTINITKQSYGPVLINGPG